MFRLLSSHYFLLCVFYLHSDFLYAESPNISIIANKQSLPFQQAISSFQQSLTKAKFQNRYLDQSPNISTENTVNPKLIYALGNKSISLAVDNYPDVPIVATLAPRSAIFQHRNVTGVMLYHSLKTQLKWLTKILPQHKQVAILYNPQENKELIQQAKQLMPQYGLKLTAIKVESVKQLPYALEQLAQNIQVVLAIPDEIVMSAKTAKAVLLASFRNKVPLVGLSDNWVKAGALYALSWDYQSIGEQCAAQAQKILSGKAIKSIAVESPNKVLYSVNLKMAKKMKLELPKSVITEAKKTFN